MAKKRKRKTTGLKTLLFFILTPFVIWALAFLIWLYWYNITPFSSQQDKTSTPGVNKEVGRTTKPSDKSAQERIGEEDRRKLEEILKSKK